MIITAYGLISVPARNVPGSRREPPAPAPALIRSIKCALSKQGHRFLSSLTAAADDPSTASHLIRKFVASSPKSVALNALSHLLSAKTTRPHLSSLAYPLYCRITEASWFNYNAKLAAELVALLYKLQRFDEAETLISEAISKLGLRERDLGLFYCNLVDSTSKQRSNKGFTDSYDRLRRLVTSSSSVYVKRRAYKAMIGCLCEMSLPREAEKVMLEMDASGIKATVFEFRSIVHGYGKLGLFKDMNGVIHRMGDEGFAADTICSNMVLSSYGIHGNLSEMVRWLRRMKDLGNAFSIRTYNSVLNSCPTMGSMLQNSDGFPLSMGELMEKLAGDEALLVEELMDTSVLMEVMEWSPSELKLDLHGMHLGSAYLILLQWMEELHCRFRAGNWAVPAAVAVICGSGKHSPVRSESSVKRLVREMMVQVRSPLRIDRKNIGVFIAKGEAVKNWLS